MDWLAEVFNQHAHIHNDDDDDDDDDDYDDENDHLTLRCSIPNGSYEHMNCYFASLRTIINQKVFICRGKIKCAIARPICVR